MVRLFGYLTPIWTAPHNQLIPRILPMGQGVVIMEATPSPIPLVNDKVSGYVNRQRTEFHILIQ